MEIDQIELDIEKIKESLESIENADLKNILSVYDQRIDQIFGSIVLPIAIMNHGFKGAKYIQYWLEGAISTGNVGKEKTEKGKKEIEKFIKQKQKENSPFDDSVKELKALRKEIPFIDDAIKNNGLNILVNTWTAFESSVKDAWKIVLNKYPKKFIFNVTKNQDLSELDGFNSKNISIGLLAKYDFDISNHLGNLIVSKFDFTGINGIEKSLESLLKLEKDELKFLKNDSLHQLELIRHLIVHNAGIIDAEYLKKSKRKNEVLNEKLKLSTNEISKMCNESIYATVNAIELIESKIK
jgi:hypothetical protein